MGKWIKGSTTDVSQSWVKTNALRRSMAKPLKRIRCKKTADNPIVSETSSRRKFPRCLQYLCQQLLRRLGLHERLSYFEVLSMCVVSPASLFFAVSSSMVAFVVRCCVAQCKYCKFEVLF